MPDGLLTLSSVHRGERSQLGYLLVVFILMGAGLSLAKGVADVLLFKRFGIEYLPLMFIFTGVLNSAACLLYVSFSSSMAAERLFKLFLGCMLVLLPLSWITMYSDFSNLVYPAYYLLFEVAAGFFLLHSKRYLYQSMQQVQRKRLMPVILAGSQIGTILGGALLAVLSQVVALPEMLWLWSLILLATLLWVSGWHRKKGATLYYMPLQGRSDRLRNTVSRVARGFRFLQGSRLFKASAFAMFFMLVASTILVYAVNRVYTESFVTEQALATFFGLLTMLTGTLFLMFQFFLSTTVIRRLGIKKINFVTPFSSLAVYTGLMFSFTLPVAIFGSISKDAVMPVFNRPVRSNFLAALPVQIRAKAELFSIVIVAPLALVVAGLLLWGGQQTDGYWLLPGLLSVLAYIWFSREMNISYVRNLLKNLKQRLLVPEQQIEGVLDGGAKAFLKEIEEGVLHKDEGMAIAYARVLSMAKPERAASLLPWRMQSASVAAKDQMIKMLQPLKSKSLRENLRHELGRGDVHLDATLYRALFEAGDRETQNKVENLLYCKSPRLRAAGIYGALTYPLPESTDRAQKEWLKLLNHPEPEHYIPGIELAVPTLANVYLKEPLFGAMQQVLVQMLDQPNPRFQLVALKMIVKWPTDDFKAAQSSVAGLSGHSDWKIRREVVRASYFLPYDEREAIIARAMEDRHPMVRQAAVKSRAERFSDPLQWLSDQLGGDLSDSPRATQAMLDSLIQQGVCAYVLQSVSAAMAERAALLQQAVRVLHAEHAGRQIPRLLAIVLEERMQLFADLSLQALQSLSSERKIAALRAGLASRRRQQVKLACEGLTRLGKQAAVPWLLSIFSDESRSSYAMKQNFSTLEDVLKWIALGNDPWLKECANDLTHKDSTHK